MIVPSLAWFSTVASHAVGSYLGSSSALCHCACEVATSPDAALLGLLQSQLDRCGPEHLHGRACDPPPPCTGTQVALVVGITIGIFIGALITTLLPFCSQYVVRGSFKRTRLQRDDLRAAGPGGSMGRASTSSTGILAIVGDSESDS